MPVPVPFHQQLLAQASHLLELDHRKPSQANVRRAASTAYYALFHFIGEEAGRQFIGGANDKRALRAVVARAFEHGSVRAVCERILGKNFPSNLPSPLQPCMAKISGDLRRIAGALVTLQDVRHRADYDRFRPLTKLEALDAVFQASDAISA